MVTYFEFARNKIILIDIDESLVSIKIIIAP